MLFVLGCGRSAFVIPTQTSNPPPQTRLSDYANVEVRPVVAEQLPVEEEGSEMCAKIGQRIGELFQANAGHILNNWGKDPNMSPTRGTLVIQPRITQLKWVTRGERIWAGSMYGNSAIAVEIDFIDKSNGAVVARPTLFTRANAMGGAYGAQEDAMLVRIAEMMSNYVSTNYSTPIGGATGVEPPAS